MKEIETDCNCAFQSSFLLFVKFDITLGKHYRLKHPGEIKNTVYAFFLGEGGGGGGGGEASIRVVQMVNSKCLT